jgi:peroxiredoxin
MVAVGDKLPEATFKTFDADGMRDISTVELCSGKKARNQRRSLPTSCAAPATACPLCALIWRETFNSNDLT